MKTYIIAIDGPAGAGKSTIAKHIANEIGFKYVDTGAMYRAVALYLIKNGLDYNNILDIERALPNIDIKVEYANSHMIVLLNGEDVSTQIRSPQVSEGASAVAVPRIVRDFLVPIQRDIAKNYNVIMDGRDIGTNVFENSDLKIFLTADVEDRANRRYIELQEKGVECNYQDVLEDMKKRDKNDSTREFAPLTQAADAYLVNTTGFDLEKSISVLRKLIKDKLGV